jgi:hypothetical protein
LAIRASVFKESHGHAFQFNADSLVSSFVALSFLAGGHPSEIHNRSHTELLPISASAAIRKTPATAFALSS